ncbi:MAG TPA: hypothetical protein VK083_16930 [Nocardia sp.]|uniref:hypothetical protein n=1 Tax=Nocardia sp. TaxID=1821 RepID=UPI002B4AE0CD|nr:hypothetical protein [Nocardia sp.]HLS78468.1 hypothetical protein [Nocardia sp.]
MTATVITALVAVLLYAMVLVVVVRAIRSLHERKRAEVAVLREAESILRRYDDLWLGRGDGPGGGDRR